MENNNPPTYIIEQTEEPSIYTLSFYTANGNEFVFGMFGYASLLDCLQYFEFNLSKN